MIPLSMWGDISRWQLMGNRFILVGDFDGQLQPIFDRWNDVAKGTDLSHSTLLHNMCNGLHVQLTEYRRGVDPELFANYVALYPRLQDDIGQLVAEMRGKYPWDGVIVPDHCLVISHETRKRVNDWLNKRKSSDQTWTLVKAEKGVKRVGCKSEPQDMRLWPGIVLIGCTASNSPSGIVHSVTYEVVEIDAEKVVVQMTEEFRNGDVEKMRQDVEALQPFVAPSARSPFCPQIALAVESCPGRGFNPNAAQPLSKDVGAPTMAAVLPPV